VALTPDLSAANAAFGTRQGARHVVRIGELRRTLPTVLTLSRRADGLPTQRLT
jgi:hypothetical protein